MVKVEEEALQIMAKEIVDEIKSLEEGENKLILLIVRMEELAQKLFREGDLEQFKIMLNTLEILKLE